MTAETPADYARRMGEHEADIPAVVRRLLQLRSQLRAIRILRRRRFT